MSSGFYTESEIEEARKKRQEEWEKVRKPEDPLEAPEQPYDSRSLYERLQEQKQKKDLEFEEAHKLKNMVKGLDDDEVDFLELVDRSKMAADKKKILEEERELNDYRNLVATLQEKSHDQRLQAEILTNKMKTPVNHRSQSKLLQGIIVSKNQPKKRKNNETDGVIEDDGENKRISSVDRNINKNFEKTKNNTENNIESTELIHEERYVNADETNGNTLKASALRCIGILPGLGNYQESSSDDCSSDSDQDNCSRSCIKLDLLGRKIVKKDKET